MEVFPRVYKKIIALTGAYRKDLRLAAAKRFTRLHKGKNRRSVERPAKRVRSRK